MPARHPRQQKASKIYVKAQRLRQLLRGNNSPSTDRVVNTAERCDCLIAFVPKLIPYYQRRLLYYSKKMQKTICQLFRNIIM